MNTLIAVVCHDESTAFEMRAALTQIQYLLLEMQDAVVLIRDLNGKVKVHQAVTLTLERETIGAFWAVLKELPPRSSALIVLFRKKVTADKVLDGLKQFSGKGRVFQTSLSKDDEKSLRQLLETPPKSLIERCREICER